MIQVLGNVFRDLLRCFYITTPAATSFKTVEEVPPYFADAFPYLVSFILLERLILYLKGKRLPPLNDGFTSAACGLSMEVVKILSRTFETSCFIYIYDNYRICDLPWNSPLTWFIAAIGVDFIFYWFHRMGHEVNLIWSRHQAHHSSEEFNMMTGLRQGIFQGLFSWAFYLPLAFFVPASHFLVHQDINLIYQFWLHTEVVDNLGPLEYVLNTPSHHRVHHGSNKYCIDKNYGGTLIIWDRLFGTFAAERKDEKIVYGLIEQVESFNPLYLQFFYTGKVYEKFKSVSGFGNKLAAIFYGPGWSPGTPRTGFEHMLPDIKERKKFQQPITAAVQCLLGIHYVVLALEFEICIHDMATRFQVWFLIAYVLASLGSMGFVYDNQPWGPYSEMARSIFYLWSSFQLVASDISTGLYVLTTAIRIFHTFSVFFWLRHMSQSRQLSSKLEKLQKD